MKLNLENALRYLTSKHRVRSTLVLRRDTGVIIHAEGAVAVEPPPDSSVTSGVTGTGAGSRLSSDDKTRDQNPSEGQGQNGDQHKMVVVAPLTSAQQLATRVLRFVAEAEELAGVLGEKEGRGSKGEWDDGSEVSEEGRPRREPVGLLRMRTGRNEIIIVPGETSQSSNSTMAPFNFLEAKT